MGLVMEKDMGELFASSVSARSDCGCKNWNGLPGGVLDWENIDGNCGEPGNMDRVILAWKYGWGYLSLEIWIVLS